MRFTRAYEQTQRPFPHVYIHEIIVTALLPCGSRLHRYDSTRDSDYKYRSPSHCMSHLQCTSVDYFGICCEIVLTSSFNAPVMVAWKLSWPCLVELKSSVRFHHFACHKNLAAKGVSTSLLVSTLRFRRVINAVSFIVISVMLQSCLRVDHTIHSRWDANVVSRARPLGLAGYLLPAQRTNPCSVASCWPCPQT